MTSTTTYTTTGTDWEALRHRVLPGGYGRLALAVGGRSPLAVRAGEHWIELDDGRRLIDVNNNMTVNLHGHAHPGVLAAVQQRIADGLISLGVANTDELQLARALTGRTDWADQVRFTNSGTEAVQLAMRVARARTGRDKIIALTPGYHGTADSALPPMGELAVRGVPRAIVDQTVTVPRHDAAALADAFAKHDGTVAALLLDLCASRAALSPLTAEYVDAAIALARDAGALVIIDEVITFRNGLGGLSGEYGIRPDIVVLGKTIGGGFPIGAIMGTRDALSPLDASGFGLEHGGTFSANPVTMAAGVAALDLFGEAAVERLNGLGFRLQSVVEDALADSGWEFRRSGSVFRLVPIAWDAPDRYAAQKALFWAGYERGILSSGTGLSCLSTVMDEGIVDEIGSALIDAARSVAPR